MKGLSLSTPMVIAWNEGRKAVTRRLMNPQPDSELLIDGFLCDAKGFRIKPRYLPGETAYIKETWRVVRVWEGYGAGRGMVVEYKTDGATKEIYEIHLLPSSAWRSSTTMPAFAARSFARIVSVRPERIREITEEEAVREGIYLNPYYVWHWRADSGMGFPNAVAAYAALWESLHPGSWEKNEFVFRYALEKI